VIFLNAFLLIFVPDMKLREVSIEAFFNYLFPTYDAFPIKGNTTDFRQKYQECYAFVKHNAKTLHKYTERLSATAAAAQTHLTMLRKTHQGMGRTRFSHTQSTQTKHSTIVNTYHRYNEQGIQQAV
jgi:uncharacterized protein YukE